MGPSRWIDADGVVHAVTLMAHSHRFVDGEWQPFDAPYYTRGCSPQRIDENKAEPKGPVTCLACLAKEP